LIVAGYGTHVIFFQMTKMFVYVSYLIIPVISSLIVWIGTPATAHSATEAFTGILCYAIDRYQTLMAFPWSRAERRSCMIIIRITNLATYYRQISPFISIFAEVHDTGYYVRRDMEFGEPWGDALNDFGIRFIGIVEAGGIDEADSVAIVSQGGGGNVHCHS
jgi:hypothetical protein